MRFKQFKFNYIFAMVFFWIFATSFSNCSNAKLLRNAPQTNSSVEAESVIELPPPKLQYSDMRVLFFVDQSFSMIQGKCPSDLDGASPTTNDSRPDCTSPEPGTDVPGYRFDIVDKWLSEFKSADADIKVAVIPFSGGKLKRPNFDDPSTEDRYVPPPNERDNFKFLDLNGGIARNAHLRNEHNSDLALTLSGGNASGQYMGTTAPSTTLQVASSILKTEMTLLKSQGRSATTQFHLVYFSDGVFKPLAILKEKAMQLAGCPVDTTVAQCSELIPDIPCLTCPEAGSDLCDYGLYCTGGLCPREFCDDERQRFDRVFGDPLDNEVDKLKEVVTDLNEFASLQEVTLLSHFLQLQPGKVVDPKEKLAPWNIFDSLLEGLDKKLTSKYEIVSGAKPFSFAMAGNNLTYRIENFYIQNLNAFVDPQGRLRTDSDGDGLADEDDPNPANSRSSDPRCLDGIFKTYGCSASLICRSDVDADGDGLNECEELTIQSNNKNEDSDKDLFLDTEVLRGLNPNTNQVGITRSNDGLSVIEHYVRGASSVVDLNKVKPENLISYKLNYVGDKETVGPQGSPVFMGTYNLKIGNIPLVQTLATGETTQTYRDVSKTRPVPRSEYLIPTKHEAGINQILILVKVVAKEQPNDYFWLLKKMEVKFDSNSKPNFKIDFKEFQQIRLGVK